jgi:CRISPR-associated endoribonuclease Cas6
MRIALTLENPRHEVRIPLRYNYLLASCIYRTLATSSGGYAEWLHQEGYPLQGKHYKPFTFSQLLVARRQMQGDQLLIQSPTLRWCIASPVDEFVRHFHR